MNSSEDLKFPYASAVAELKDKWPELRKSERDYWRAQFASSRTSKSIRSEMVTRLGVFLYHDVQLTHFRKWVARQDAFEAESKLIHSYLSVLSAEDFKSPVAGHTSSPVRWLYYQCLRDLERRASKVLASGHSWTQAKADEFYRDALCLCTLAWLEEATPRPYLN